MKIFGVGANRTGTTSLTKALQTLGYRISHWQHHEQIRRCLVKDQLEFPFLKEYDGATDLPIPSLYRELDKNYPGSKFILTVRDERDWIRSQQKHHQNIGIDKPFFECFLLYGTFFYDEELYLKAYRRHNATVQEYFKDRPNDLLVIDITKGDSWDKICNFVGKEKPKQLFPKENCRIKSLSELYDNIRDILYTDKGTLHSYIEYYEELFRPIRNKSMNVLEIGVLNGGSIWMWSQYFQSARIYGIDKKLPSLCFERDVVLIKADATKPIDQLEDIKFGLVIDDGSHHFHEQHATFKLLWPKVEEGGLYIIEDLSQGNCREFLNKTDVPEFEIEDRRHIKEQPDDTLGIWRK